jgi:hypothetical protein
MVQLDALRSVTWLESTGGPLILLEEDLVPYWRGYLSVSESSLTDYERACEVSDYLGTIGVGSRSGLLLGEQPYSTTWLQAPESDYGVIVRWVYAESEAAVIQALNELSNSNWQRTDVVFEVTTGKLVLFDSASPGYDIETFIAVQIPKGSYVAETLHYDANEATGLTLHRFVPKPE